MLKRNWNWRNHRLFCHIFVIAEISIGGPAPPPLAYAYATSEENKKSAILEPRTGQFSRTWGFDAKTKAKAWSFEAKAKDFKISPRGQGRPWGLHLCSKALVKSCFCKSFVKSEFRIMVSIRTIEFFSVTFFGTIWDKNFASINDVQPYVFFKLFVCH